MQAVWCKLNNRSIYVDRDIIEEPIVVLVRPEAIRRGAYLHRDQGLRGICVLSGRGKFKGREGREIAAERERRGFARHASNG